MALGHCVVSSRDWQMEVRAVKENRGCWTQPIVACLLYARWERRRREIFNEFCCYWSSAMHWSLGSTSGSSCREVAMGVASWTLASRPTLDAFAVMRRAAAAEVHYPERRFAILLPLPPLPPLPPQKNKIKSLVPCLLFICVWTRNRILSLHGLMC